MLNIYEFIYIFLYFDLKIVKNEWANGFLENILFFIGKNAIADF